MNRRKSITSKTFGKRLRRDLIKWTWNYRTLMVNCRRDPTGQPPPHVQAELDDAAAYIDAVERLEQRWLHGDNPNALMQEWVQLRKIRGTDRPRFALGALRIPRPRRDPTAAVVDDR